uniref:Uncharacterized protein n=1 Tax=Molossus molossus TaxID=27622 RepID=A0A7J8J6J3_MOLMO|nr:hypothetical protein HJG59_009655 [Molossus molossus]
MATKISTIRKHFPYTSNKNNTRLPTKQKIISKRNKRRLLVPCWQGAGDRPVRKSRAERNILNLFNCKRQSGPHSDFGIAEVVTAPSFVVVKSRGERGYTFRPHGPAQPALDHLAIWNTLEHVGVKKPVDKIMYKV